jgi:hypothetical protein
MKFRLWRWMGLLVVIFSMVGAGAALAQQEPTQGSHDGAPVSATAPGQISPLVVGTFNGKVETVSGSDEKQHLAYELRLTNITGANLSLERVRVLDPSRGGRVVDTLTGSELDSRTSVFGDPSTKVFGPGVSGFLFMDVTYPVGARLPEKLYYRVDVSTSAPTGLTDRFRAGPTYVSGAEARHIGSPLRGKNWLTGEGCCDERTSHRAAIFPTDGIFHGPERFAIDWVQIGENDRLYKGPRDELSSYPYYGANLYSVADGLVVETRDDQPEQTPGQFANGLALNDFGGNYVVIKIADGTFAYYAHLQKGKKGVLVEKGDRVSEGQAIGKLGNTGNTDAPHLHFMLIDGKAPFTSRALPFEIDSFRTQGRLTNYDDFLGGAKAQISAEQRGEHRNRLPLHRTVNVLR